MWLARSLPPLALLSRLRRPASAHRHSLVLGGTWRAYASAGAGKLHGDPAPPVPAQTWPHLCNSCGAKQEQRRRHLYVVLDDWKHGFSLHKISSDELVGGGDDGGVEPRHLPDPILRFDSRSIGTNPGFHALGSNVVVTTDDNDGLTLVYDTETATLRTGNRDAPHEDGCCHHAVAAGNNLYTLDSKSSSMLNLDEYAVPHWEVGRGPTEPFAPYKDSYVSACALHPDGRTIFVSVRRRSGDYRTSFVEEDPEQEDEKKDPERWSVRQLGTFALDTQSEWECWTQYDTWYLPFEGQAHYDSDLGAWVGKTHAARDGQGYRNDEHEHLCSYDVPDLRKEEDEGNNEEEDEEEEEEEDEVDEEEEKEKLVPGVSPPPVPRWSLAAEKLTFLEPKLKSTGSAVLLHTGGRGTFCLVERALRKGVSSSRSKANGDGDGDDCLLRVTMCRIRYGRNGELVAAPLWPSRSYLTSRYAPYWPGRSYLTPSNVKDFDVRAFWI